MTGREDLRAGFEGFFKANEGARLEVETKAVKLLTENVAIEDGTADVTLSGSSGTLTGYTAIHVLKDGAWLLDRVIETDAPASRLEDGPLGEIAWLEGVWVDEASQRLAFTIGDSTKTFLEIGLDNLTKDEAPMWVHFTEKNTTQTWLLVRLESPEPVPDAPGPAGS